MTEKEFVIDGSGNETDPSQNCEKGKKQKTGPFNRWVLWLLAVLILYAVRIGFWLYNDYLLLVDPDILAVLFTDGNPMYSPGWPVFFGFEIFSMLGLLLSVFILILLIFMKKRSMFNVLKIVLFMNMAYIILDNLFLGFMPKTGLPDALTSIEMLIAITVCLVGIPIIALSTRVEKIFLR